MVFIFRASMAYASNMDQFTGYEMVALNGGNFDNGKYSDSKRQFEKLQEMYKGMKSEKADLFVKFTTDGKTYSNGRVTGFEMGKISKDNPKNVAFSLSIETMDAAGKMTGKVETISVDYNGLVLDGVYHTDETSKEFMEKKITPLEDFSLTLLAVQKNGVMEEWKGKEKGKDKPSEVYSSRMQTIASKVNSIVTAGMTWEELIGKDIIIPDPSNPLTDEIRVNVLYPCWEEGKAVVFNKKTKLKPVLDFNEVPIFLRVLEKGK